MCVCAAPGCSGEHHEGEDAQERREVVVLLARQKQRQQIGNFTQILFRGIISSCVSD